MEEFEEDEGEENEEYGVECVHFLCSWCGRGNLRKRNGREIR
jgi:hypothetical protein